jgi:hypothetical protein
MVGWGLCFHLIAQWEPGKGFDFVLVGEVKDVVGAEEEGISRPVAYLTSLL